MSTHPIMFEPGDIFLTSGKDAEAGFIAAGQVFLNIGSLHKINQMPFVPAHAALSLGGSEIIDAMPGTGVKRRGILDLLEGVDPAAVVMVRHPDLVRTPGDPEFLRRLLRICMWNHGKPYQIRVGRSQDETAFCSEFVADVLTQCGLQLPSAPTPQVYPVHFLKWAMELDWRIIPGRDVFAAAEYWTDYLVAADSHDPEGIGDLHDESVDIAKQSLDVLDAASKLPGLQSDELRAAADRARQSAAKLSYRLSRKTYK